MQKKPLFFTFICLATIIVHLESCKEDKCSAGTGGNVTLRLEPQHHGKPISSSSTYRDTAYLKFDATDFPGPNPSNFDIVVAGNPGENFVNISGLKCGQYYIMMTGFDTSASWNIRVVGGVPLNFSDTDGLKTIVVPVTE